MMFRRRFIAILTGVALCMTSQVARADDRSADDAISAALAYLSNQQIADGSFEPHGQKLATTGLGLLAFVSTGNTSDGGRYAATVRRATEFLLRQTPGDRYFGAVDGSRMYGHAIVTLALCDAYGVEPDETIRARILRDRQGRYRDPHRSAERQEICRTGRRMGRRSRLD